THHPYLHSFPTRRSSDLIQKRDAQGNWSIIATPGTAAGQIRDPTALAADTAGNLYVVDSGNSRLQKRDVQGTWSMIATYGTALRSEEHTSELQSLAYLVC